MNIKKTTNAVSAFLKYFEDERLQCEEGSRLPEEFVQFVQYWSNKYPNSPTLKTKLGILSENNFYYHYEANGLSSLPPKYFEEALEIDPFCNEALEEYAAFLYICGDYKKARLCCQVSNMISPTFETFILLSRIERELGNRSEATKTLQNGIDYFAKCVDDLKKELSELKNR